VAPTLAKVSSILRASAVAKASADTSPCAVLVPSSAIAPRMLLGIAGSCPARTFGRKIA
jgi:hypothetical protein